MKHFILSVTTEDETGLIAAITASLFDQGANCGDTSFSVLGQKAMLKVVFSLPIDIQIAKVEGTLKSLPALENAEVEISEFIQAVEHHSASNITHQINIHGGDHQGLLAQISEELIAFNANVVRLNCKQARELQGDVYHIELAVSIPKDQELSCLSSISKTASDLQLECQIKAT